MTKYVRAKGTNVWHWCTNCSNYPDEENIEGVQYTRPSYDLCNQCKAKEKAGNCSE